MSLIKELWTYLVALFSVGFFSKKIDENELIVVDGRTEGLNFEIGYQLNLFSGFKKIKASRRVIEALSKIDCVAEDKKDYNPIINMHCIGNVMFITFISESGFVYFVRMLEQVTTVMKPHGFIRKPVDERIYEITDVLYLGKSRIYDINNIEDTYTRNMVRIIKREDITNENFKMEINIQKNTFVLSVSNIKQFAKYRQRNTDHFEIGFSTGKLVFLDKKSSTKKLK